MPAGCSDANGMTSASFAYQWLRSDSAISGATGFSYTVTSYQILRRRPPEGETTLLVYVDSTGSTSTTYTDTGTTLGNTHYVYGVKARNSAGLSRWSNFARIDK